MRFSMPANTLNHLTSAVAGGVLKMESLSGFRHAIEHAGSAEALKLHVLDRVGETLGCDRTGLYFFEPGSARPTEIHVRHLPEAFVLQYEQLGREEDKVLARAMKTAAFDSSTMLRPSR